MVRVVSQAKPRLVAGAKRRSKSVKPAQDINQRSILEFVVKAEAEADQYFDQGLRKNNKRKK